MTDTYVFAENSYFSDDLSKRIRVAVPDGWRRVWRGRVVPGDLYLNRLALLDGREQWEELTVPSTDVPVSTLVDRCRADAEAYTCVIRRGAPVRMGCEHCQARAVRRIGERYCPFCVGKFLREVECSG